MKNRGFYKVVLSLALVMAVAVSLWFAAPARALDIDIGDLSSTRLGNTISFDVTVSIEDTELLPIQSVDLYIEKDDDPTKIVTCEDLPLIDTIKTYPDSGSGEVVIDANPAVGWGYAYGYGYAGWEGTAYYFGYGYGYGPGPTSITYSVTWDSPSTWPAGDYDFKTAITANGDTFTEIEPVSLTRGGGGGGGGGGGPDKSPPRISNILPSGITKVSADIYWETHERSTSQVEYWNGVSKLSPLDEELVREHLVHLTGLTPGATYQYKTMSMDAAGNLAVSDAFTFITLGTPATLSVNALAITPTEVSVGEEVTITVIVNNSGDASGTYNVILKIDNKVFASQEVVLAGGTSETLTFTTSQDVASTYTVSVDGLSGNFTVKAVPLPPPPTPEPEPPAKPINWWLIGGIIAVVVAAAVVTWLTLIRQRIGQ